MTLCEMLRNGKQADADGVEVTIPRQAAEEAADEIERLQQIEAFAKMLIEQKGRHNTETAYKRLAGVLRHNV